MKVNQRDLVSVVNELQSDNALKRYVARVIFVSRLETYYSLIGSLSDEADVVVDLSDYCAGEDAYPDIKRLIAFLDDNSQKTVLIKSIGEYLQLCTKFEENTGGLYLLLNRQVHSRARVWIPVFSAESIFQNVIGELPEERFDDAFYEVVEEPSQFITIVYGKAFERSNKLSAHGLKQRLRIWDDLKISSGMAFSTRHAASINERKGDYSLHIITSPFSLIKQTFPQQSILLEESLGTESNWAYLAQFIEDQDRYIDRLICVALNVQVFDFRKVLIGWQQKSNDEKWLIWLWYKLNLNEQKGYVPSAIVNAPTYNDIVRLIELHIFSLDPGDQRFDTWLLEREQALSAIGSPELSEEFWAKYQQLSDRRYRIKLLTSKTHLERTAIIEIASDELKSQHSLAGISSLIQLKYPRLLAYLQLTRFFGDKLSDFIRTYKLYKLMDVLDDIISGKAASIDLSEFDTRATLLNQAKNKYDAFYYWVDGMGVEWVDILLQELSVCLPEFEIESVKVGTAAIPTVTHHNMEVADKATVSFKYDRLDSIGHVKDRSEIRYAAIVDRQLDEIAKIAISISNKLHESKKSTLVITADHGMSRMAAKAFHEKKASPNPSGAEICCLGRYCEFPDGIQMPSKRENQIREGRVIAFRTYDHFTASGYAPGEIHGGSSPEEVLVPVIILKKKAQANQEITSPTYSIIPSECASMNGTGEAVWTIRIKESVESVDAMLNGKIVHGVNTGSFEWSFSFINVVVNNTYTVHLIVDKTHMRESYSVRIIPTGLVVDDDFM